MKWRAAFGWPYPEAQTAKAAQEQLVPISQLDRWRPAEAAESAAGVGSPRSQRSGKKLAPGARGPGWTRQGCLGGVRGVCRGCLGVI
jgi:hypothetical protein